MTISHPAEIATAAPLAIVGRERYRGYIVPLAVQRGGPLAAALPEHPRFAIVHVAGGSCVLNSTHGLQLIAAPAVILLDEATRPELLRQQGLELRVAYFDPSVVNSAFSPDALRETPAFAGTAEQDAYLLRPFADPKHVGRPLLLPPALSQQLDLAFSRMSAEGETQRDLNWPCRTRSFLIELLFQLRVLVDEPALAQRPAATGNRLDQALLLVHEWYNRPFTLKELAQSCGSNRTALNTHFRSVTGQSVRTYTVTLRISTAAALLRDTLLPIAEIMNRVGYDNPSSFTRQFKKLLGLTPRDYRKAESWMLRTRGG
ncbi:MAG: hypothetical protein JWQ89_4487 [Devosia sp.]|uniref:helix-turn-helix domain-containing protein n=1 Tax=Devosia sp. TaxID=1871048 RepID=UPI00261F5829|nr:AraC family transcriptional regulator [Devosia sp.]MDB5542760.1 hypothetical protein [Devosia sp.]